MTILQRKLIYLSPNDLKPHPANPRKHSRAQIRALAKSIEAFGFNAPILVDREKQTIAGHGRLAAARHLNMAMVPVILLDDLTEVQLRAYMLADNKLADRSSWDEPLLAAHLKELSELSIDFDIEATGFESPEIDLRILSLDDKAADEAEDFALAAGEPVTRPGDRWILADHVVLCGSALDRAVYDAFPAGVKAAAVFTDPPYNVPIEGHVSGLGKFTHREFAQASGEMGPQAFAAFLSDFLALTKRRTSEGALMYCCMDWRHMQEMRAAADACGLDLVNLCVWVKTNGGMGSFYRSRHELVFVFRNGSMAHLNNIQLGRFGRNRTNVWHYPGANVRSASNTLQYHPTPKPVAMVADALLDCTKAGDYVLDPFLGSGTTLLAAERTRRRALGIELDPIYVDTAIARWQRMTGGAVKLADGRSFADVKAERTAP